MSDVAGLYEALDIIYAAVEAWKAEPNAVAEPPHWAATNALIQTIAVREGKSIGEVAEARRQPLTAPTYPPEEYPPGPGPLGF